MIIEATTTSMRCLFKDNILAYWELVYGALFGFLIWHKYLQMSIKTFICHNKRRSSCLKYSRMFSKYLISSEWKSQGGDIFKNEYMKLVCSLSKCATACKEHLSFNVCKNTQEQKILIRSIYKYGYLTFYCWFEIKYEMKYW